MQQLEHPQKQNCTDHMLIQQAYNGEMSAFGLLVDRYRDLLHAYVCKHLGRDDAEDVLQFVWLQCFRSLPKLASSPSVGWNGADISLKSWLFRVAANRCVDEIRRKKRQPAHLFSELECFIDDEEPFTFTPLHDYATLLPEEWVERHDVQQSIHDALQELPVKYRAIIWLRYSQDLKFPEIGRRLQIPTSTAKTYHYRACAKLRSLLSAKSHGKSYAVAL
ncbi:RNA polymerase sigma factor [Dictyobacter alpinus]|uniref:RNA polymerase sigma factor n=1 Tax=Dictyobacter alpinus TaxID=2014873 RepID=A0A402BBC1_9CHLR|nr:sigma-70 family RNA polymerase sigma factor [Dictyobacter alpinus]GCE28592.1 RNA polymerase sigma factor [Dictyobacter alpinus]